MHELYRGSINFRGGYAIATDYWNKCLNEVFSPATKRETGANFQPVPEPWHRGRKFKRNMSARRPCHNGYNDALLRLVVSLVRYQYPLTGLDTRRHQHQSASFIDGDCIGLLVERIATYAVDGQRETDVNPTRPAAICVPGSGCLSDFGLLAFEAQ